MSKRLAPVLSLALVVCLGTGAAPAQASEVVKLARLVLTGKRTSAGEDRTATPAPAASQPADVAAGGAGGDNDSLPANNAATGTQRRSFVKSS